MEQTITDISHYRKEMAKSMVDKLFFIEEIEAGLIVDFGCADGVMLDFIKDLRPNIKLIGYDISEEMVNLANNSERWKDSPDKPLFTSNWDEIKLQVSEAKKQGIETAITLSSVIHEVYSYGTPLSIKTFWHNLFETGFDYIIIRDMLLSKKTHHDSNEKDVEKIYTSNDPHIQEFESMWGKITNYKNLLHFLLKYRYNKNWFRELRENYLPITLEEMLSKIPTQYYSYEHYEHYILPFIKKSVKKEFGINLTESTHIKLILKKKNAK